MGLRAARLARGVSQEQAARIIGRTQSHFGKIERGQQGITLPDALSLAAVLKIEPAEFYGTTDEDSNQ